MYILLRFACGVVQYVFYLDFNVPFSMNIPLYGALLSGRPVRS
jgi:hypothetical protein